jgi:hypothetical protein
MATLYSVCLCMLQQVALDLWQWAHALQWARS